MNKIIDYIDVKEFFKQEKFKTDNSNIVLCHGCFDIVHPGHIRHLKFAKNQGSFLVVSITPDSCIQKGVDRPLVPQELRAESLASFEFVDAVVIAPKETGIEMIKSICPDIYVKGSEYALSTDPRFLQEKEILEGQGGKVVYSSGDVVFSSSEFIRECELITAEAEKLNYLCQHYNISKDLLNNIVSQAKTRKILVVSEALIDEYKYCDSIGISQDSATMSLNLQRHKEYIGGGGSIAQHFSSIEANIIFLSSININDELSRKYKKMLNNVDVKFENIQSTNRKVIKKMHFFADRNQVLEVEEGNYIQLDSSLQSLILKKYKKMLKELKPDCVILSDFGYGLLSDALVPKFLEYAGKLKIKTLSDISVTPRTNLLKFKKSDIFVVTERELRAGLHDFENGLSVLVLNFYNQSSIKEIYLLLSDGGVLYFKRPSQKTFSMENIHIPSLTTRMDSLKGNGEAFIAGIVLARTSGATPEQSVYFGAIFSSLHTKRIGNEAINQDELYRHISNRKELI